MENTFGNYLNQKAGETTDNTDKQPDTAENRTSHTYDEVLNNNFRELFEKQYKEKTKFDRAVFFKKYGFVFLTSTLVLVLFFKKDLAVLVKNDVKTPKTTPSTQKPVEDTPLSIWSYFFGKDDKKSDDISLIDDATQKSYLKRFAQVAVTERHKFGIPASIILANALLQSQAGTRETALKANNQFGLPASVEWTGTSLQVGKGVFRQYENAWVSFRDHSIFISSGKFANLRALGDKDYKAWAKGLETGGFPSNQPQLAQKLVAIIEKYSLQQLDNAP